MDDPSLRQRMGQMGRERIEKTLAWPYQAKLLLQAYATLRLRAEGQLRAATGWIEAGKKEFLGDEEKLQAFTVLCVDWAVANDRTHLLLNGKPTQVLAQVPAQFKVGQAHPRLFFNAGERAALSAKAATSHQSIWSPILAYVDQKVGTTPPAAAPVDGDMETYRNFGNGIIPLAFVCVVTQAADCCTLAKIYLLMYAAWQQWDEADTRGLGLAHMLMANAIAYDWLYDKLTLAERATVRTSLATGRTRWTRLVRRLIIMRHGKIGGANRTCQIISGLVTAPSAWLVWPCSTRTRVAEVGLITLRGDAACSEYS